MALVEMLAPYGPYVATLGGVILAGFQMWGDYNEDSHRKHLTALHATGQAGRVETESDLMTATMQVLAWIGVLCAAFPLGWLLD